LVQKNTSLCRCSALEGQDPHTTLYGSELNKLSFAKV
jgi:hypothetical protein